jgi:two-component system NtrC family sensor kinase
VEQDEEVNVERLREEVASLRLQLIAMGPLVAVGRLAAGVIHEINSPIASIFSNLDVLEKSLTVLEKELGEGSSPASKRVAATMHSLLDVDRMACERISAIIRSLKTHARTGDEEFREAKLDHLLDDTLRLVRADVKDRIEIRTEYENVPPVRCIAHLMGQAFLNLLVNAAQAIEDKGTITVRLREQDGSVVVEIEDTGVGIPLECKEKILAGGFTTKPVGVGTGLGLEITRQIVVGRHGGSLDFESEPGKGTTFFIRIPLRPGPAEEA